MRGVIVAGITLTSLVGSPVWAEGQAAQPPTPVGTPGSWLVKGNYPQDALNALREGRTVVELGVNAEGKIVSCTVKISSGTASLDETSCRLPMKYGSFRPATDENGQPVAGTFELPITWANPLVSRPARK